MIEQAILDELRRLQRERCYCMDTRKSIDLRLGQAIRTALGWRKNLPEKERKKIAKEAAEIMAEPEPDEPFREMILVTRMGGSGFVTMEDNATKKMEQIARGLPIWKTFGKGVRGFGEKGLAVIIAEAGDLSNYATEAKLWKRMGLAAGQGRVPPNLSREARKQAWIDRGYSPARRSRMWVIGDSMLKSQIEVVRLPPKKGEKKGEDTGERKALGPYGEVYLRRKLHTQQTHPEWWSDKDGNLRIDEETGRPISIRGHRDAQRIMEKRLLRDLWRAWRRTTNTLSKRTMRNVSAASIQPGAAE